VDFSQNSIKLFDASCVMGTVRWWSEPNAGGIIARVSEATLARSRRPGKISMQAAAHNILSHLKTQSCLHPPPEVQAPPPQAPAPAAPLGP